jgi:hypothetical protein
MSPSGWMIAGAVGSWPLVLAATGGTYVVATAAGLAAPLVAAVVSWQAILRTHRVNPLRVQHVILHGFLLKLLFFASYLIVMLRLVGLPPAPFVLSFTGYFLALYVAQALLIRRLGQQVHASV